ncbi:uncharacterized protein LOC115218432 isoform X1 [Argonauta hians]
MNGFVLGLCLFVVIGGAMSACDFDKVNECQSNYLPGMEKHKTKEGICKHAHNYINCLVSATSSCEGQAGKLDEAKKMLDNLGCEAYSSSGKVSHHTSVVCVSFLAAVAFKKLIL